ncbi:unnamed protein product [Mesocestoides corti]|uniref:Protein sleepless n=1 Tax=Mesocestoides corti TaxID=53468 RepID=A0A0R3UGE9_MESCO|nr:unnamed protein product [Mesocestoides corti]
MLALIWLLVAFTGANLTCYECEYINWQYDNSLWPCDQSAGPWKTLTNCTACIKQTEVQKSDFRKPRWGQEETVLKTTTRYCVVRFPPNFPDQCIYYYGSSSVMEQCFCSSDFCNTTKNLKLHSSLLLYSMFILFLKGLF